ncbi:MAG: glycosyltransferase [Clostridium sp.]
MNGNIDLSLDTLNYLSSYNIEPVNDIKFTSIVILTYNQLECTKLCIESIRKFTPKDSYEIIVVDNKSTDDTVEWLKEQEDLVLILNENNNGFPVGCNQGIQISKGESILLLNNDTIVTPNWLNNLNKALYSDDKIGAVGAVTNHCSNLQQIGVSYTNIEEMISFASSFNVSNKDVWDYRNRLVGFCYLVKKEVINKVGVLDPIFTPGNYEDDDFSLRIQKAGYYLLLCKDTFIHHFGSASFGKDVSTFSIFLHINKLKLNQKWGFNVGYSNNARYDLIEFMKEDKSNKINVLEVGCGTGATLLQIKNVFRNANVYGIEIDENAASIASGVTNTIVANIESSNLDYEESFFDYIILGDVLEHLINPWETLKKLGKYLKITGKILASVPNVNHISIIKSLLNGNFTYEDSGILDRTHLRFFTSPELQKLFQSTGFEVSNIKKLAIHLSQEDANLISELCKLVNNNEMVHQFTAYQYLIVANKIIDKSRYNQEEMKRLRYMIMRIDNLLDSYDSMNYIFDLYSNSLDYFLLDMRYFIKTFVINKGYVVEKLVEAAKERELTEILEILGGLKNEFQ